MLVKKLPHSSLYDFLHVFAIRLSFALGWFSLALRALSKPSPLCNYYLPLRNGLPLSEEIFSSCVCGSPSECWIILANFTRLLEPGVFWYLTKLLISFWAGSTCPYFLIFLPVRGANSYSNTCPAMLFLAGISVTLLLEAGRQLDDFTETF